MRPPPLPAGLFRQWDTLIHISSSARPNPDENDALRYATEKEFCFSKPQLTPMTCICHFELRKV
jgi:hypothetical protein